MPVDMAEIERLERQLAEARAQLEREKGKMYDIIKMAMTDEEWTQITGRVKDRKDRILLGLEAPEPTRRVGGARSATRSGDLTCEICGETNFSARGLNLHRTRVHGVKGQGATSATREEEVGEGEEHEAEGAARRR